MEEGVDFINGECIAVKGDRLTPAEIALLAAVGQYIWYYIRRRGIAFP